MQGLDHERLRSALARDRYEWRRHALERIDERGIPRAAVLEAVLTGVLIEDYPDDQPHPSALFLGGVEPEALHVVVAMDAVADWAYIITAYRPDPRKFGDDLRTRREQE
ncbi:MAG: DUF4258 domain-containing protein [Armatimonadetes bacterium]|nr:DUF4258 domain-containing protein [Armatimonadota bacterium]